MSFSFFRLPRVPDRFLDFPQLRSYLADLVRQLEQKEIYSPDEIWGEMYATNITQTVTVSAINTAYEVSAGFTAGVESRVAFGGGHYLAVTTPGTYQINWGLSISTATPVDRIEGGYMINGAGSSKGTSHTTVGSGGGAQAIAAGAIETLAAGDQISLFVRNHTATRDITVEHGHLLVVKLA